MPCVFCSASCQHSIQSFQTLVIELYVHVDSSATIYLNQYQTNSNNNDCSDTDNLYIFKFDQDVCSCYKHFTAQSGCSAYQKVSLSGSTWTWYLYSDNACTNNMNSATGASSGTCQTLSSNLLPGPYIKGTTRTQSVVGASRQTFTCTASMCSRSDCVEQQFEPSPIASNEQYAATKGRMKNASGDESLDKYLVEII